MFGWWQNSSRSVYFASQGKTGVYILSHKIIVTCEIIFFVYVAWRKICTVMSFSYSLKMFGWRQNSSWSGYFASWGKMDTAWVIQKYRYWQWKLKNIGIGPKKPYQLSSTPYNLPWQASVSSHQVQCNIPTIEALLQKNVYLFLERCRKSNMYGCTLWCSQIVYIRPYFLNTTNTIAVYFINHDWVLDVTVFVHLRACHATTHLYFIWSWPVLCYELANNSVKKVLWFSEQ